MLMRSFRRGDWVITPTGRLAEVSERPAYDGERLDLRYLDGDGGEVRLREELLKPAHARKITAAPAPRVEIPVFTDGKKGA